MLPTTSDERLDPVDDGERDDSPTLLAFEELLAMG